MMPRSDHIFEAGEKELIASILDAPHFLSGFDNSFSKNGYIKKYRNDFFPEEVQELEGLDKMQKRITTAKEIFADKILSGEIFDHKAIDRAESLEV